MKVNVNKKNWDLFVEHSLENTLKDCTYERDEISVSYELINKDEFLTDINTLSNLVYKKQTYSKNLQLYITVKNIVNQTSFKIPLNVVDIPCYIEDGFVSEGNVYEIVATYKKLNGYYITKDNGNKKLKDESGVRRLVSKNKRKLSYFTSRGAVVELKHGGKDKITVEVKDTYTDEIFKFPLHEFLMAITEYSIDKLFDILGDSPVIRTNLFVEESITIEQAIRSVAIKMHCYENSSIKDMRAFIRSKLSYFKFIGRNDIRYNITMNFKERVLGEILAEDIIVNNITYKEGTTLNYELLSIIDESDVKELMVLKNDRTFKVIKYPSGSFSQEFLTALNWFILYWKYDFKYQKKDNEQYNVTLKTIDVFLSEYVETILNTLSVKIVNEAIKSFDINLINRAYNELQKTNYNSQCIIKKLKESTFFQQNDGVNILYNIVKSSKITDSEKKAGDNKSPADRDIFASECGRICPLDSPESASIGVTKTLTFMSKVDEDGYICTPYINIKTNEKKYFTAYEDKGIYIGLYGEDFNQEFVKARIDGEIKKVKSSLIEYRDVCPIQILSYGAAQVPFIEHTTSKRIEMQINQAKAGQIPIRNQAPIVRTGFETTDYGIVTSLDILNRASKINTNINSQNLKIKDMFTTNEERTIIFEFDDGNIYEYTYSLNAKTVSGTISRTNINYKKSYSIKNEEIIFYNSNIDINRYQCDKQEVGYKDDFSLDVNKLSTRCNALGRNVNIFLKMQDGYNYEDAIIINKRLFYNGDFDSLVCNLIKVNLSKKNNKAEETFNGNVGNGKIKYMQRNGLPAVGTVLRHGDIVIGRVRQSLKDGKTKDVSRRVKRNEYGTVINSYFSQDGTTAYVIVGRVHEVAVGDKLVGRHGNKGVISKLVEPEDMPFNESGVVADMVLTNLGFASRMCLGFIFEGLLGLQIPENGFTVVEPFNKDNKPYLEKKLKENNYKLYTAYDGVTGEPFDRKVCHLVGYMLPLNHLADKKLNQLGLAKDNINPITQQPKRGIRLGGGQRNGEMEVCADEAHGAINLLNDELGLMSDYKYGEYLYKKAVEEDPYKINIETKNNNSFYFKALLRCVGYDILSNENGYKFVFLTDRMIEKIGSSEVSCDDPEGLHLGNFASNEFMKERNYYGYVDLGTKIVNPMALSAIAKMTGKKLIAINNMVNTAEGLNELVKLCETFNQEEFLNSEFVSKEVIDLCSQYDLKDFVLDRWLICPSGFRPANDTSVDNDDRANDLDILYKRLFKKISLYKNANELTKFTKRKEVYDAVAKFSEASKPNDKFKTVKDIITGGSNSKNIFRKSFIGKILKMSGRAVIVVDPKLRPWQIKLPHTMIIVMYKENLIKLMRDNKLLYPESYDTDEELDRYISIKLDKYDLSSEEVNNVIINFIFNEIVTLGRQPTLHKYNKQGFELLLTKDKVIKISPLICKIYNADFDGDQAYVDRVLNSKTKTEVKQLMMPYKNLINVKDNSVTLECAQDVLAGIYYATMFRNNSLTDTPESPLITDNINHLESLVEFKHISIHDFVCYKGFVSTAGRILFNYLHPSNFNQVEFKLLYDKLLRGSDVNSICKDVVMSQKDIDAAEYIYRVSLFGFKYATSSGLSLTYDDFETIDEVPLIIEECNKEVDKIGEYYSRGLLSKESKKENVISLWNKAKSKIKDVIKYDRNNNLFIYIDSGARGSLDQLNQISGIIGNIRNTSNEELETAITSNYKDGISYMEYFTLCYGTRKGLVATALETKDVGYTTRQANHFVTMLKVVEEDCKATSVDYRLVYKINDKDKIKLIGNKISSDYIYYDNLLASLGENNVITTDTIKIIENDINYSELVLEDNTILKLNYKLDTLSRSVLLYRYCESKRSFLTEEDINNIEKQELSHIDIRMTLNCKSIGGICSTCYGLKYDKRRKPEIGEHVGYESAQAMSESSQQATLRVFHDVTGNGSVLSGDELLENLMNCRFGDETIISPASGIISHKGDNDYHIITDTGKVHQIVITKSNVKDGDFVVAGQKLDTTVMNVKSLYSATQDINAVQMELLRQYSNIYYNSSVKINARHMELFVKMHTQKVIVLDKSLSHFNDGEVIYYGEAYAYNASNEDQITYEFLIMSLGEIVKDDWFLAASFEDPFSTFKESSISKEFKKANSNIGKACIGEDLVTEKIVDLTVKNVDLDDTVDEDEEELDLTEFTRAVARNYEYSNKNVDDDKDRSSKSSA